MSSYSDYYEKFSEAFKKFDEIILDGDFVEWQEGYFKGSIEPDDLTADIFEAYEKATEKGYSSWEEYYTFSDVSDSDEWEWAGFSETTKEAINAQKMRRARSYVDMFKDSNPKTLLDQLKTVMTLDEIREFLPETGIDVEIYEEWREVKERRKEVLDKVSKIYNIIPDISTHITDCPTGDCSKSNYPVAGIITHLNDKHDWSRNEIADWLETLPIDLTFPIPDKEVTHEHGNQDTPGQGAGPADDQDAA